MGVTVGAACEGMGVGLPGEKLGEGEGIEEGDANGCIEVGNCRQNTRRTRIGIWREIKKKVCERGKRRWE